MERSVNWTSKGGMTSKDRDDAKATQPQAMDGSQRPRLIPERIIAVDTRVMSAGGAQGGHVQPVGQ
jgi:hypothetical protein